MIREAITRLRYLFLPKRRSEVDDELAFHLEQSTAAFIAAGASPAEARRMALVEIGGIERTREQAFLERPGWWLATLRQDVHYALRGFLHNPVFTLTVLATLMAGIGATTAVFSVVDRILFRPLPYAGGDRLVSLGLGQPLERQEFTLGGFFFEWRDNQKPFQAMTYEMGYGDCNLTEGEPLHLHCISVAQNFMPTMGVALQLGRNFTAEEDVPNGPRVVMITDGLWLRRFNRSPDAINQQINIDGHLSRIVGVLPRDFEMPRLQPTDIVLPAQVNIAEQHTVNSGIGYPMWAFARLKPGVSLVQARAEMQPLYLHTQQWIPPELRKEFQFQIRSLRDRQMQDAYRTAWVLLGAVLAVLLIACANVASLFSARGAARQRELAVRSALGASRGRLARQTFTEAVLLAVVGAAAGCLFAEVLLRIFIAIAPTGVPLLASARLDLRIVVFTVALSFVCAALFGIVPALEKPRTSVLAARQTRSNAHARLRRLLVAAQIGLCVVLLSGASLLVRSFWNLEQQNLGMQTRNVITVHVPLNGERYPSGLLDFYLRAEAALRRLPGITAVGMSDSLPPSGGQGMRYAELRAVGKAPTPAGSGGTVAVRHVTPDYFKALQIPIVNGTGFTEAERETKDHFMILSRDLAARLFPGEDAVGKRVEVAVFNPYLAPGPVSTVVGVAANVRNSGLSGDEGPEFYQLATNQPDTWSLHHFFVIDSSLPLAVIAPLIRSSIGTIDPTAPVEVSTMTQNVSQLADRPRFEAALLGFFALCGLLMAVIGVYGVISFVATQRTQEIGVRMALGATRVDILRLIAGEGVRLIVLGGVVGLAVSLAATQLLGSLLFGVSAHDPLIYAAVVAGLALVALAATLIPAHTAMKVEPVVALRHE